MSIRNFALSAAALACLIAAPSPAKAGFIITFLQVGSDVVATGSGTINTTALTQQADTGSVFPYIDPASGSWLLGASGAAGIPNLAGWSGIRSFSAFGTGHITQPSFLNGGYVASGNDLGETNGTVLNLPTGYISGSSLSNSSTWLNTTIAGLGITPGTYNWTWGSGATADFLRLTTTASAATPEPASFTLLALGSLGALLVRRHRRA